MQAVMIYEVYYYCFTEGSFKIDGNFFNFAMLVSFAVKKGLNLNFVYFKIVPEQIKDFQTILR